MTEIRVAQSRKLAAILAADAAGYSRLMQDDDRATVAMLDECRTVFRRHIETHQGRVVDMAGDSILAIFETATGAVQSALDIQNDLSRRNDPLSEERRMRFRIGVNLGEVIAKTDGTIYGDGVNIAARLQSVGEPGGICISGNVHEQVKNPLRAEFEFAGEQQVKNIAGAVRTYRLIRQSAVRPTVPAGRAASSHTMRKVAGLAAIVVAVGAASAWWYSQRPPVSPTGKTSSVSRTPLPLPDKPSIAVLPFVNMSGDKEQEYFSDGMTEDVITSLSKLSGLFVIARNSVFTYKGQAVKPEQVSKDLGVRYVLEGSVRKAENRVRITAQLIDGTTGYHLWAENYDGELKDIFALQDGITRKIVTALAPKLTAGEQSGAKRQGTHSIEAYDLFLRGMALFYEYGKDSHAMARQMFERAIAIDPNYARAHVQLAWVHFDDWEFQWIEGSGGLDRALEAGKKAVALDAILSEAHVVFGWSSLWKKQHDTAIAELERAVSLDQNSDWANSFFAETLNFAGRPDEAIAYSKKSMRLDPNYPPWVAFCLAHSYYLLRRNDEAVAGLQDSLRRHPNFLPARRMLAAFYGELGREKEAQAELSEILRISPGASLELWRARLPYKNPADLERFVAGLRKAGLK
ncbi:MAG: adenylate/guanylate cyclase domain-containing protein [Burkholderiales bacterium]